MKKIYILIAILALQFTGCNKDEFLDQPLRGRQQLDDYFSSGENAELFVNSIYAQVNGESWYQIEFFRQICEMATDDNWAGNTEQPRPDITGIAAYNVFPGSSYINSFWENTYIGITRANIALERIPEVDMDADLKARLMGEARFLRAWYYFDLVRNFGGVPIITTYTELLQPDITSATRASSDDVYDFVESELLLAIPNLPLKSQYAAADMGRVTQGAAQTLLAKAYLYREKWSQARDMAQQVIASGEYQLEPSFEDIHSVHNHHGVESIFEVEMITNFQFTDIGGTITTTSGSRADQGWGWCVPSSDLENAFLEEGDDIRLRSTIIKHGEAVYGDPEVTSFDAALSSNKSGRINRKAYIPVADRESPYMIGQHPLPVIRFRFADVILIHAEASYFMGDQQAALQSLKEIRDRVSLDTDMNMTGSVLRDAIWKERRLELALEQQRLYDLRRQKVNGVSRLASIMGPNGSFVQYNTQESIDPFETTNTGEAQNKGYLFDVNVHLLWPIPPEEIQLSGGSITQNPGY